MATLGQIPSNTDFTGIVMQYAGSTAPDGWLLCDGSAVSRTTYADLFAVAGTTYGAGDGSTTFNLPDFRGRVPVGLDNMGGNAANRVTAAAADTLGGADGEEKHILTTNEMPPHSHSINSAAYADSQVKLVQGNDVWTAFHESPHYINATGNLGGGSGHNVMQPYLAVNYIVKT